MKSIMSGDTGYHPWVEEDCEEGLTKIWLTFLLDLQKFRMGRYVVFNRAELYPFILSVVMDARSSGDDLNKLT